MKLLAILIFISSLHAIAQNLDLCPDGSSISEYLNYRYVKCASGKYYQLKKGILFKKPSLTSEIQPNFWNKLNSIKEESEKNFTIINGANGKKEFSFKNDKAVVPSEIAEYDPEIGNEVTSSSPLNCLNDLIDNSMGSNVMRSKSPSFLLSFGYKDNRYGDFANLDGEIHFLDFSDFMSTPNTEAHKEFKIKTSNGKEYTFHAISKDGNISVISQENFPNYKKLNQSFLSAAKKLTGGSEKVVSGSSEYKTSLEVSALERLASVRKKYEIENKALESSRDYDSTGLKEIKTLKGCQKYFEKMKKPEIVSFIEKELMKFENYVPLVLPKIKKNAPLKKQNDNSAAPANG